MKKLIVTRALGVLMVGIALVLILPFCRKTDESQLTEAQKSIASQQEVGDREGAIPVACGPQGCSDTWGTYTNFGYHIYTDRVFDLSGFSPSDVVSVNVAANEVPNRFEIRTLNNTLITGTGWMGYSNYTPFPCGSELSSQSTVVLTFVRGLNTQVLLRVETCAPQNQADTWWANYNCPPSHPCEKTCCDDCGKFFSGSFNLPEFHIYPNVYIDLHCIPTGTWICLVCDAVEVPNRFNLVNYGPGTSLQTTDWIGAPNYLPVGCWQQPLGQSPSTMQFQKLAGYDVAVVRVETCPPRDQTDSWLITVNCDCKKNDTK